ncbi:MAG: DNA polymerase III subunit gamma/tau, partial [Phycisphaerae bacterium]|nr:DNA polymerase III subunit gamma/tau [Phycisphaerae bacterium]
AIQSQRLHHGYLFCGTRGVGKTSVARILARSLNCLSSDKPTIHPCCTCESCMLIAEGQDVDVIEIDAASNTGVDNIRELRSNTVYRPARSRFKIYIIDEVHMLSTGAFNALLKTLEEPPGHVKFIMATTEIQKVPATIQSRCLRFDFRSISAEKIAEHFARILEKEKIDVDPAVLRRVAKLANGSMRDGLSLLDQLLSMGSEKLTIEMLEDVLPSPHDEMLTLLLEQMASRDAGAVLASLDTILASGYSLDRFTESLAEQLRALMLLNVCGPTTNLVDLAPAVAERMQALAKQFDAEGYVFMIAVLEELRRNIRFSALGRALTEAALVRLASGASYSSVQNLLSQLEMVAPSQGIAPTTSGTPSLPASGRATFGNPVPTSTTRPSTASAAPSRAPSSSPTRAAPVQRATSSRDSIPPQQAASSKDSASLQSSSPRSTPSAPTPEEIKAAKSEPLVREAMDLFQGTLVNVEKQNDKNEKK